MAASAAMGMKEICLTAHHEGGFALWPSKFTNYSVAHSAWYHRQEAKLPGSGNVLRRFVDAANRWGIGICYYLNVQHNGYFVDVEKIEPREMLRREAPPTNPNPTERRQPTDGPNPIQGCSLRHDLYLTVMRPTLQRSA